MKKRDDRGEVLSNLLGSEHRTEYQDPTATILGTQHRHQPYNNGRMWGNNLDIAGPSTRRAPDWGVHATAVNETEPRPGSQLTTAVFRTPISLSCRPARPAAAVNLRAQEEKQAVDAIFLQPAFAAADAVEQQHDQQRGLAVQG